MHLVLLKDKFLFLDGKRVTVLTVSFFFGELIRVIRQTSFHEIRVHGHNKGS